MAARVTKIPATLNRFTMTPVHGRVKRKVAGYARVSTAHEDQQTSYEAQMDYYKSYISSHDDWEFVGMYSDEGITATNTKRRDGFNRMIDDALAGKINLIVTKSISRFARNTVDSLTAVRKLKDKGIEVYFEKENIWTLDSKGELLITIMSSLAQEESRSISENTSWGIRKAFADGKVILQHDRFLGYDKDFAINREEANTVRLIYKLFLSGLSCYAIKQELERRGRMTALGGKRWYASTIISILKNVKYKGDALLQKEYTIDFLQKKRKKNEGELPQYYIEGHHEPIIQPEIFALVQAEFAKREGFSRRYSGVSVFSSKIKCGECGGWYGAKVWHSNDKYRKQVYRCNHKYRYDKWCSTPVVTEEQIKRWFLKAMDLMITDKAEVIHNLKILRQKADTAGLIDEQKRVHDEITRLDNELRSMISDNAKVVQNQYEYNRKYTEMYGKYEQNLTRSDEIEEEIKNHEALGIKIDIFIDKFGKLGIGALEFDENLWAGIVEYLTVYTKQKVVFTFVGGIEISVEC